MLGVIPSEAQPGAPPLTTSNDEMARLVAAHVASVAGGELGWGSPLAAPPLEAALLVGLVVAVIAIHQQTGEITSGPELITRGVLSDETDPAYLDEAKAAVLGKLREITPESRADLLEVEDEVRRTLKKFFSKTRGRRPLIVPHVFEM